jgi:hypothetical protein
MRVNVFLFIHENRRMKSVEILLRQGEGEKRENNGGSKSKIYCKHTYKYNSVVLCTTIIC